MRTILALSGLLALLAACGGGSGPAGPTPTPAAPVDGSITVRAFEWGFEPASIVLPRGDQVTLVLDNQGDLLHNLKVDELDAEIIESRSSGPLSGGEGSFFVGADDHDQGTLVFVPLEPGTYVFYCTLEQHRELGMEGAFEVQ